MPPKPSKGGSQPVKPRGKSKSRKPVSTSDVEQPARTSPLHSNYISESEELRERGSNRRKTLRSPPVSHIHLFESFENNSAQPFQHAAEFAPLGRENEERLILPSLHEHSFGQERTRTSPNEFAGYQENIQTPFQNVPYFSRTPPIQNFPQNSRTPPISLLQIPPASPP